MQTLHESQFELSRGSVTAKPVLETLWRVVFRDGSVRGHISLIESKTGLRYAAKMILPGGIRTLFLGEFWSIEDALDCFV